MKICPRCGRPKMFDKDVENSLSRTDNKTYICNDCGDVEALMSKEDMEKSRIGRGLRATQKKG